MSEAADDEDADEEELEELDAEELELAERFRPRFGDNELRRASFLGGEPESCRGLWRLSGDFRLRFSTLGDSRRMLERSGDGDGRWHR